MSDEVLVRLTQGAVTVIDEGDADRVQPLRWYALRRYGGGFYAVRDHGNRKVYLHRFVMDAPEGLVVDHINGDTLDNRRSNLRCCTHAQNTMNQKRRKNRSGFRGVKYEKRRSKWVARLRVCGRSYYGGAYELPEDAAKAYDELARKHAGEYARLNFGKAKPEPRARRRKA